jgi:hypothetical protein
VSDSSFEHSFKKHLVPEQRREILETLRATLKRETTLGEIVDAADELGWSDAMGELRLSDLAGALVSRQPDDVELDTDEDDAPQEPVELAVAANKRAGKKKATKKKAAKKKAAKKKASKKSAKKKASKKSVKKKASKKSAKKKASKKSAKKKASKKKASKKKASKKSAKKPARKKPAKKSGKKRR